MAAYVRRYACRSVCIYIYIYEEEEEGCVWAYRFLYAIEIETVRKEKTLCVLVCFEFLFPSFRPSIPYSFWLLTERRPGGGGGENLPTEGGKEIGIARERKTFSKEKNQMRISEKIASYLSQSTIQVESSSFHFLLQRERKISGALSSKTNTPSRVIFFFFFFVSSVLSFSFSFFST